MKPGVVLAHKYRLVSLLGEGGMGAVWRAEDVRLGSAPVAIKLLHERDASNPELRARFDAEARIAAKLRSPHVVQLYDVGIDDEWGVPFLAMELLEGETLHDRLTRVRSLAAGEVAHIVSHVARALSWAHSLGIVHRDLKPANIFLVQNADSALAKVLDFGVAKRTSHSLQQGRTATGVLLGTPLYMSPEQILSSRDVDHRADLWSLAVIAVQCLTGRLPFDADNLPGLALQICHGQATLPSRLGDVPRGFDAWFERGTRANAAERFASAVQMADELRAICNPRSTTEERAPPTSRADVAPATQLIDSDAFAPAGSVGPLSRTSTDRPTTGWRKRAGRAWIAGAAAVAAVVLAWLALRREPLPSAQLAASQLAASAGPRPEEQPRAPATPKPVDSAVRALEPEQKAPPLVGLPEPPPVATPAEPAPVIAPIPTPRADAVPAGAASNTRTPATTRLRTSAEPTPPARAKTPPRPTPAVTPGKANTRPSPPPAASPAPDAFRTF